MTTYSPNRRPPMTISLNSVVGVLATLSLMILIGSVGVLIFAEILLRRSRKVLDFAFFVAARNDEERSLRDLDEEHEHQLIYNRGYSRGYADGEYEGMKRFKVEQEASDERAGTSEASGV